MNLKLRGWRESGCGDVDLAVGRQELLHKTALVRRRRRHVQFPDRRRRWRRWRRIARGEAVVDSPLLSIWQLDFKSVIFDIINIHGLRWTAAGVSVPRSRRKRAEAPPQVPADLGATASTRWIWLWTPAAMKICPRRNRPIGSPTSSIPIEFSSHYLASVNIRIFEMSVDSF